MFSQRSMPIQKNSGCLAPICWRTNAQGINAVTGSARCKFNIICNNQLTGSLIRSLSISKRCCGDWPGFARDGRERAGQHLRMHRLQQLGKLCGNPQMAIWTGIKCATKQSNRHIIDGSARRHKPPISGWSVPRDPQGHERESCRWRYRSRRPDHIQNHRQILSKH